MSDDGDMTCPLCTEEMDLTDLQLKPCKCGYEICVWCWHHIMEMSAKDGTEGRCPACRSPFDKERIVAMDANCERTVAKVNTERRSKTQRSKLKTSVEARKNLINVRVVQRNLVYVVGLPSSLSDESVLERKQYFGQYGKVLKVSITRPVSAAAQQAFNTNTFSVYITYAREEEAIRCIQAVHDFVLEGRLLRACFGTSKYCHNWLRNMSCSIPDCMYLHEIGSQKESFTKDEVISAYTRSRVPQIASSNLQRRSGDVLPPPLDDIGSCMTVPCTKTMNISGQAKIPNSNGGRCTSLPPAASWGARASNCRPLATSMSCTETPVKQKLEIPDSSSVVSSTNANTEQASAWNDDDFTIPAVHNGRRVMHMDGLSRLSVSLKPDVGRDCQTTVSNTSSEVLQSEAFHNVSAWDDDSATSPNIPKEKYMVRRNGRSWHLKPLRSSTTQEPSESGVSWSAAVDASCSSLSPESCSSSSPPSASEGKETELSVAINNINLVTGSTDEFSDRKPMDSNVKEFSDSDKCVNGSIQNLCLDLSSVNIDDLKGVNPPYLDEYIGSTSNVCSTGMHKTSVSRLQNYFADNKAEGLGSGAVNYPSELSSAHTSREFSDWSLESDKQVFSTTRNEMNCPVLAAAQEDMHSDVKNETSCSFYSNHSIHHTNCASNSSPNDGFGCADTSVNGDSWCLNVDEALLVLRQGSRLLTEQELQDNLSKSYDLEKALELPDSYLNDQKVKCVGRAVVEDNIDNVASVDIGENSISDILDYDPWDNSLSLLNKFARLIGKTSNEDTSLLLSNSVKSSNNDQSRSSFARQENQLNQLKHLDSTIHRSFTSLQDPCGYCFQNVPQFSRFQGHNAVSDTDVSSDKNAGVPWQQILSTPEFSLATKVPSPGFSFSDRGDWKYDVAGSENKLNEISSHGNQYQIQHSDNVDDMEFIDPAILAVGRGQIPQAVTNSGLALRSSFSPQFSTLEIDPRVQPPMHQSASLQNYRTSDHFGDRFLHQNDAYITSLQNQRISDHNRESFLPLNDTYIAYQHLPQGISNQSPYAHLPFQQARNSHNLSTLSASWNDVPLVTSDDVAMAEMLRRERFGAFGLNNYYPSSGESKFHIPNASDFYSRSFGI